MSFDGPAGQLMQDSLSLRRSDTSGGAVNHDQPVRELLIVGKDGFTVERCFIIPEARALNRGNAQQQD
ncbi:hypothetical protein, partial [Klebsiella pneumoniae]|uniref:hypothetical protein n=1 Tax=Klebsiella pneumoniae TaxID=573 RepID=UPI00195331CB